MAKSLRSLFTEKVSLWFYILIWTSHFRIKSRSRSWMRFILLSNDYSNFQIHYDGLKLVLEWYGPVDFTDVASIGLSNIHIFPLERKSEPYSAVISANFIQPTLYNPQKILSTIRIDAQTEHTPLCNFKGKFWVWVISDYS